MAADLSPLGPSSLITRITVITSQGGDCAEHIAATASRRAGLMANMHFVLLVHVSYSRKLVGPDPHIAALIVVKLKAVTQVACAKESHASLADCLRASLADTDSHTTAAAKRPNEFIFEERDLRTAFKGRHDRAGQGLRREVKNSVLPGTVCSRETCRDRGPTENSKLLTCGRNAAEKVGTAWR